MGDRVRKSISVYSLTNNPGQLSLVILPWVDVMSTTQRCSVAKE